MDKQKRGKGKGIGFSGGMLDGIPELIEKQNDLAEKRSESSKSDNIKFKKGKNRIKKICGFSVKTGLGDKGVKVEPFGSIRKDEVSGQPVVFEMSEPVVDIFEEDDHTLVIAEMPGISEEDITLEVKDDLLFIHVAKGDKKYRKEVLLPGNSPGEKMTVYCNNVADEQRESLNDFAEMAAKQHFNLVQFLYGLNSSVSEMREGFCSERTQLDEKLTKDLGDFISDLMISVSDLKAGFNYDHAGMAMNLQEDLDGFISGLKTSVSDLQSAFNRDHAELSINFKQGLKTFISELKTSVDDMQKKFSSEGSGMAYETKAEREVFLINLRHSLNDIRKRIGVIRHEFASDISGARKAWHGNYSPPQAKNTTSAVHKHKHEEAVPYRHEDPIFLDDNSTDDFIPDDFTQIRGIGLERQRLLNEAGINTFAQLAASSPQQLHEALGSAAKNLDLDELIDEATRLVQG